MQRIPHLYFGPSDIGGRGVFTTKKIPKGSVIEICPVIVLPVKDLKYVDKTVVFNYYFEWGDDSDLGAIALGYGSLYNHSYDPNARYLADYEMGTLDIHAIKDIPAGSEIFTNYNGEPTDKSKLWFKTN
jgi:SET domain-containing protein